MSNFKTFFGNLNNRRVTGLLWNDNKQKKSLVIFLNNETNHWEYEGFSDENGLVKGEIPDKVMMESINDLDKLHIFLKKIFD